MSEKEKKYKVRIINCKYFSEEEANKVIEDEEKNGYEPISISLTSYGRLALLFRKKE